jgi:hypothetical protein
MENIKERETSPSIVNERGENKSGAVFINYINFIYNY